MRACDTVQKRVIVLMRGFEKKNIFLKFFQHWGTQIKVLRFNLHNTFFFGPFKVVFAWVTHFTAIVGISDGPLHAHVINKAVSFLKIICILMV